MYDISDRESFLNIQRVWVDEVAQKMTRPDDVLKLLVGNKCDLSQSRRAVPYQEAQVGVSSDGLTNQCCYGGMDNRGISGLLRTAQYPQ